MPKALSLKRMDSTTTQNMDATISEHLEHVAHAIHLCNCSGGTGPHLTDPPLGSGPQSIPKPYKFKTTDPQGKPTTSAICRCCKAFLKRASDYARHYDHMHRCTGIWYLCPFCDMHVDRELRNLMVHILNQ
ncbi:hypothetical protein QCA50_019952 [Cerrena zonata]|uniref:C2H2-type domain-containing protein n=1 Tax=Cerrena zonata TaxID=2478898 RepID=A0AAW0FCP0_9APHY